MKIYGIGPVLAKKLSQMIRGDVSNVRQALRKPDIFYTLPVAAQTDLLYNPLRRIPRDIIHIIDGELHKYLRRTKFVIAGSYLRGKLTSGDIDIVMHATNLNPLYEVNANSKQIHIMSPFSQGPDKAAMLFEVKVPPQLQSTMTDDMTTTKKVRVKVDIFLTKSDEYMYTLLFATGSGQFNIRMRAVAKRKGYLLNQRGLYKNGKKVLIRDEKHLFKILNMTYRLPVERIQ